MANQKASNQDANIGGDPCPMGKLCLVNSSIDMDALNLHLPSCIHRHTPLGGSSKGDGGGPSGDRGCGGAPSDDQGGGNGPSGDQGGASEGKSSSDQIGASGGVVKLSGYSKSSGKSEVGCSGGYRVADTGDGGIGKIGGESGMVADNKSVEGVGAGGSKVGGKLSAGAKKISGRNKDKVVIVKGKPKINSGKKKLKIDYIKTYAVDYDEVNKNASNNVDILEGKGGEVNVKEGHEEDKNEAGGDFPRYSKTGSPRRLTRKGAGGWASSHNCTRYSQLPKRVAYRAGYSGSGGGGRSAGRGCPTSRGSGSSCVRPIRRYGCSSSVRDLTIGDTASVPSVEYVAVPEVEDVSVPEVEDVSDTEVEDVSDPSVGNDVDLEVEDPNAPEVRNAPAPDIEDVAGPAVEYASDTSVEDVAALDLEDAASPSVEDVAAFDLEDAASPSVEDVAAFDLEDAASPSVEDVAAFDLEDAASPSVEDVAAFDLEDAASPSVEDVAAFDLEDAASPSVEDVAAFDLEDAASPSVEDVAAFDLEDAASPSVEDVAAFDLEDAASPSVEDVAAFDLEDAASPSVEDVAAFDLEDAASPSVEDVSAPEVRNDAALDVETVAAPGVEDAADPSIEDISNTEDGQVANAEAIVVDNPHGASTANTTDGVDGNGGSNSTTDLYGNDESDATASADNVTDTLSSDTASLNITDLVEGNYQDVQDADMSLITTGPSSPDLDGGQGHAAVTSSILDPHQRGFGFLRQGEEGDGARLPGINPIGVEQEDSDAIRYYQYSEI